MKTKLCKCGCKEVIPFYGSDGRHEIFYKRYHNNRGKIPPSRKGTTMSESAKLKIGLAASGENSYAWKGDNATYGSIHDWVDRWKGKPDTCEMCGTSGLTKQQIHWANIDHEYRRVLDDYIRLCVSCHRYYDIDNNNYKKYA